MKIIRVVIKKFINLRMVYIETCVNRVGKLRLKYLVFMFMFTVTCLYRVHKLCLVFMCSFEHAFRFGSHFDGVYVGF